MERTFQRKEPTKIFYGKTVASLFRSTDLRDSQIIFCGNQRYYDHLAEKLNQFVQAATSVDWFITTNNRYCNDFRTFEDFISFMNRFSPNKKMIMIGIGNQGVMELMSFYQQVAVFDVELWLMPLSLRAFAQSLNNQSQIISQEKVQAVMATEISPQRILFDQTLADQQITGKIVDLLVLIRCGIVLDYHFLQQVFRAFPTRQVLNTKSSAAFIDAVIDFYQDSRTELASFDEIFTAAFFQTENGHLLSDSMKNQFGLLFAFFWNGQVAKLDFNFKNFMIWLMQLDFPVLLPAAISLADYGEQVVIMAKGKGSLGLAEVGKTNGYQAVTEVQLDRAFANYTKVLKEIRGTINE